MRKSLQLSNTIERMERFYSNKYGLISFLGTSKQSKLIVATKECNYMVGNVIPIFRTNAIVDSKRLGKDCTELLEGEIGPESGFAVSLSLTRSRVKAIGEFIERYCAVREENECVEKTLFDSYNNLLEKGVSCIKPETLIQFEDNHYDNPKFAYKQYFDDCFISWIEGTNLVMDEKVWLPIQKVFTCYPFHQKEECYISGISTGLACGSNYYQAVLGGIYEVVERDSFMLTWLLKLPGKCIEVDYVSNEELRALYRHILRYLVGEDQLYIYDISKTEGIYTILTFIRNNLHYAHGLVVAAASHTNPEIALLKALEEVCQIQQLAYYNLISDNVDGVGNLRKEDVDTLVKHCLYYNTGRRSCNIDFISFTKESISLSELRSYSTGSEENDLEYVLNLFCQKKQMVYVADITKPEISEQGFHVVKAIIPSYFDLETQYCLRVSKNERLKMFQQESDSEINEEPHPFS